MDHATTTIACARRSTHGRGHSDGLENFPGEKGPLAQFTNLLDAPVPPFGSLHMELAFPSPDASIEETLPRCKHCDRPFPPRHQRGRPQLHCSDECRLAHRKATGGAALASWQYHQTPNGREVRRQHKRRRHGNSSAPVAPTFNRLAIYDRDDWRCQLCGVRVKDSGSAAMESATIRLLVPAQAGGLYAPENCETSCRQCCGRAGALVARSLADPNAVLPRSLRWNRDDASEPTSKSQSTATESFGAAPATSVVEEEVLAPAPHYTPQDAATSHSSSPKPLSSNEARNAAERA